MSRLLLGDYPKIGSLFQSPTPLCWLSTWLSNRQRDPTRAPEKGAIRS